MKISRLVAALLLLPTLALADPPSPRVLERYKQMLATNPAEGIALDRLWNAAAEAGTTDQLLEEYRKLETFPGQMVLGLLLRKAGQEEEAIKIFGKAAALNRESPLPALAIAKLELASGHPKASAVQWSAAIALLPDTDPRKADALLQLGATYLAAGEAAKAAAAWEWTVTLNPGDLELRRRLATAYMDNDLPEPAITHLEYVVEHGPPSDRANALQQIARLQSAAGHPGEAMKALERAVAQTSPENWMRGELLGQIIRLAQRQRIEPELESKWKKQVEQAPRDLGGYLQLVEFYERTGELEKEREWLEKVMALVPKNFDVRLKLARLLVQLDRLDKATPLFDELLTAQPTNTDLIFERSRLDLQREDPEPARARIKALLARKPGDETLRAKALDFYQEFHLHDLTEQYLQGEADKGGEDEVFALASFYFSQRRVPEAQKAMARLLHPEDPPARRAAILLRTAQTLKSQGEVAAAVEAAQAAAKANPKAREIHLVLGELLDACSQFATAREAYREAYRLSSNETERQEADGKVFQSIRTEHANPAPDAERPRQELSQAAVEDYIRGLMTLAGDEKTAQGWLRVAQWKAWNGDKASAVIYGTKAAELEPANPAPHEFLARLAIANSDPGFAVMQYQQLIEANPARRSDYEREIAGLQLQRGSFKEALQIFTELARRNPGSGQALADLANAQEHARKLEEAAETWRKALAALPARRQHEAATSLLHVLQELGRHEEATGILLRAVDETADERERLARFDELLLYAQQHERLDWLRAKFEERRKMRADDYFTAVALGRILKAMGEKGAAFDLFADAALSAPKQAEALPELIREAEEQQRLDTAVRLQEQLTRTAPQSGPDGFIKLAALCEKTGDLEGAERAWARALAKFPRDLEVLRRAADYHQQWGDLPRAAGLLSKQLVLDPANPRIAAALGKIEFDAGKLEEARAAYETVMRLTKPVELTLYPGEREFVGEDEPGNRSAPRRGGLAAFEMHPRSRSLTGFANGKPTPEMEMRLDALRRLAEIAQRRGGAELNRWLGDWSTATDGTEAIWALYYSGARGKVLDRIEARCAADGLNRTHRRAWMWYALESGEERRIANWLHGSFHAAGELAEFTGLFNEFVRFHPDLVNAHMVSGLFPAGSRTRMAQTSFTLLGAHRYAEALSLGQRVLEISGSTRAAVARELAQMQIALGHNAEALQLLEQAAEGTGEWLDSPVYEAMRDYCRLAPPEARTAFMERKLSAADGRTKHGLITRVLLYGLSGQDAEAAAALDALLRGRAWPAVATQKNGAAARAEELQNEWRCFINGSATLANWSMPGLARRLWEQAFADPGLRAAEFALARPTRPPMDTDDDSPSPASLMEMGQTMRDALAYLEGGRIEREAILREYGRTPGAIERLADQLGAQGARDAVVEVSYYAWLLNTRDPADRGATDPFALRRLMDACAAASDEVTAENVRARVLADKLSTGSDSTWAQIARELSEQYERRGDYAGALKVVEKGLAALPDEQLAIRRMELLLRAQGPEAARTEILTQARARLGTAVSAEQMSSLLEALGDPGRELLLRLRAMSGADPRLPQLLYRAGKTEEARTAMEKLPASYSVYAAMTLAESMGLAGDARGARSVLVATANRVTDPRAQLQLRSKLLRIPGAPPSVEFAQRMQARMRASMVAQPDLAESYYQFFDRYGVALGLADAWKVETDQAWADGKGPFPAGLSVLKHCLAAGDVAAARTVCERLAARVDVTSAVLDQASTLLAGAKQTGLRLLLAEADARSSLLRFQPGMAWVRLLHESGNGERARAVLEQFSALAMFDGGAEVLGRAWLDVGDVARARDYLQRALTEESLAPRASLLAGMARVQIASKRLPAARLLLRRAFEQPSCKEFETLTEYLEASGELPRWRETLADWALAPSMQYGLKLAIFARLEKQGRAPDALSFLNKEPGLISFDDGETIRRAVTGERLRALARKAGAYREVGAIFTMLDKAKVPGAAAELLALQADEAEGAGQNPEAVLAQAFALAPLRWEFARRLVERYLQAGDKAHARTILSRYLETSGKATDREAAFELWEKSQG